MDDNKIYYGWSDFDLHNFKDLTSSYEIMNKARELEGWGPSIRQCSIIKRVVKIKRNDIVLLPSYGSVSIGIVDCEHVLYDKSLYESDSSNYFIIKWKIKNYPRNKLTAGLQSALKYRATVNNISSFSDELENCIKNIDEDYNKITTEYSEKDIDVIFSLLENRATWFSDNDFEDFVLHLFLLNFSSTIGYKNSNRQEAIDGKDITLKWEGLHGVIIYNIQIKQHEGKTGKEAITQISKSDNSDDNIYNVVVSSTKFDSAAQKEAKKNDVILIDGLDLAQMIHDNFHNIDIKYKEQLRLVNRICRIEDL